MHEMKPRPCDFHAIFKLLMDNQNLAVITIISRKGSTPRLPGTRMLIAEDGSQIGTIGGGAVEAEALAAAREALNRPIKLIMNFSIDYDSPNPVDMICGGSLEVLIESLPADPYNIQLYNDYNSCAQQNKAPCMFVPLPDKEDNYERRRFFIAGDNGLYGNTPGIDAENLLILSTSLKSTEVVSLEGKSYLAEPFVEPDNLYIFGAGHVSREVCLVAGYLGFSMTVADDRPEFINQEHFLKARRVLLNSFSDCFQGLPADKRDYILIMTRGHRHDLEVLKQALKTPACYIGMIGSRNKWQTIFKTLIKEGYSSKDIDRVHCPVGLKIGADSPEEIAISIMAQIIQIRGAIRRK